MYPSERECIEFQATHPEPLPVERGIRKLIPPPGFRWVADVMRWESYTPGDWIFIQAGTGLGKTTFIEEHIVTNYPRVLYLTNRISNREQFEQRNRFKLNLKIMSYQSLERNIYYGSEWLDTFDVIICDELQYIHVDSTFANTCGITVRKLIETKTAIKFAISATLDYAAEYIIKQLEKRLGFDKVAKMVRFYEFPDILPNFETVAEVDREWLIARIKESDHRWLIFVESSKIGREYASLIGDDAIFLDRESINAGGEEKAVYEKIINEECFATKCLVITAVADSGLNLRDKTLKSIVLDVDSRVQLKQMLGRKRFYESDDSASVYIIHRSISELKVKAQMIKKEIDMYTEAHNDLLHNKWPEQIVTEESVQAEEYRKTIYCDKQIKMFCCNLLGKYDLFKQQQELWTMIRSGDPFKIKLQWLFGRNYSSVPVSMTMDMLIKERIVALHKFMTRHVGKIIPKLGEEMKRIQKEFSMMYWNYFGINKEQNQRADRVLSIDKINVVLTDLGIPIEIEQKYIKKKSYVEVKEVKKDETSNKD